MSVFRASVPFPRSGLIVAVIPRDGPIVLAADATLEPRKGRRI